MTSIVQDIMQETAVGVARREAASMQHWADYHPNVKDAAHHYAERRGLQPHDSRPFRERCDNLINDMRWAWIVQFCERWGINTPVLP